MTSFILWLWHAAAVAGALSAGCPQVARAGGPMLLFAIKQPADKQLIPLWLVLVTKCSNIHIQVQPLSTSAGEQQELLFHMSTSLLIFNRQWNSFSLCVVFCRNSISHVLLQILWCCVEFHRSTVWLTALEVTEIKEDENGVNSAMMAQYGSLSHQPFSEQKHVSTNIYINC